MMSETLEAHASKRMDDSVSLFIQILNDGKSVKWCFASSFLRNCVDTELVEIQYDYKEIDEEHEPRAYINVLDVKHYLDEFVLVG